MSDLPGAAGDPTHTVASGPHHRTLVTQEVKRMDTARRDAPRSPSGDSAGRPEPPITALPPVTATGDGPSRGGNRRGALYAAGVALLAALGVRGVAAKQHRATSEQHRNPNGHDHGKRGKRGKRGEAGPGGPAGGPGSPGDKGDQGPGKSMLTATTSWRPGTLFAGQSTHTNVEVPDAAEGDPVVVGLSSIQ